MNERLYNRFARVLLIRMTASFSNAQFTINALPAGRATPVPSVGHDDLHMLSETVVSAKGALCRMAAALLRNPNKETFIKRIFMLRC